MIILQLGFLFLTQAKATPLSTAELERATGLYVEVRPHTTKPLRATRVFRERHLLVVDFWKLGDVRRIFAQPLSRLGVERPPGGLVVRPPVAAQGQEKRLMFVNPLEPDAAHPNLTVDVSGSRVLALAGRRELLGEALDGRAFDHPGEVAFAEFAAGRYEAPRMMSRCEASFLRELSDIR